MQFNITNKWNINMPISIYLQKSTKSNCMLLSFELRVLPKGNRHIYLCFKPVWPCFCGPQMFFLHLVEANGNWKFLQMHFESIIKMVKMLPALNSKSSKAIHECLVCKWSICHFYLLLNLTKDKYFKHYKDMYGNHTIIQV